MLHVGVVQFILQINYSPAGKILLIETDPDACN